MPPYGGYDWFKPPTCILPRLTLPSPRPPRGISWVPRAASWVTRTISSALRFYLSNNDTLSSAWNRAPRARSPLIRSPSFWGPSEHSKPWDTPCWSRIFGNYPPCYSSYAARLDPCLARQFPAPSITGPFSGTPGSAMLQLSSDSRRGDHRSVTRSVMWSSAGSRDAESAL